MRAAYALVYLTSYRATHTIPDEGDYLALARAIWHGTVFVDRADGFWGPQVGDRPVSKYSMLHSEMLAPAFAVDWRRMLLVSAGFFIAGAFILRRMLLGHGLGSGWCLLHFMLAGGFYHSQSMMTAVPSAVRGLLGVSAVPSASRRARCSPDAPFGTSILLHSWMGPLAMVFALAWNRDLWIGLPSASR